LKRKRRRTTTWCTRRSCSLVPRRCHRLPREAKEEAEEEAKEKAEEAMKEEAKEEAEEAMKEEAAAEASKKRKKEPPVTEEARVVDGLL
jgi:IMP dehydrogenase/GMP reductase